MSNRELAWCYELLTSMPGVGLKIAAADLIRPK
jgi:hypothetical protein